MSIPAISIRPRISTIRIAQRNREERVENVRQIVGSQQLTYVWRLRRGRRGRVHAYGVSDIVAIFVVNEYSGSAGTEAGTSI